MASPSEIIAPEKAAEHRGWALWYDFGHFEHGIAYRETKWRARSPTGDLIENPPRPGEPPVDGFAWLKKEIDRKEAQA